MDGPVSDSPAPFHSRPVSRALFGPCLFGGVTPLRHPMYRRLTRRFILTSQALLWYSLHMAIDLPPDLEQSVRRHLSSGQYSSAEDVLRAALHQFDEMDVVSLKHSAADETAGRVVSLQAVVSSIRQKHNFSETR